MTRSGWMIGVLGLGLLAACAEREVILPGVREDVRAILDDGGAPVVVDARIANRSLPIRLPATVANADWTQRIGTQSSRVAHAALSSAPQPVWSAAIGAGDSRKGRITADPVVAGGRVFTMDASARVSATSTAGAALWQRDLTPPRDRAGEASGGGIAFGNGKVFVTSGFGSLTALDPSNGAILWQQELDAAATGAPTVYGDLVYLVSGDDTAWAIETDGGRVRWQLSATPDVNNAMGAAAPAVNGEMALFAFGDGEVQGAFRKGGLRMWDATVSGQRRFSALSKVDDITADPVIDGDVTYVGSNSGRLVALRTGNGERIWTAKEGAMSPVWPTGGSVFAVTDANQLVRFDASDGSLIWAIDLPGFVSDRPKKQAKSYAHFGPVLAGGRLVVASGDGLLRFFDPASGAMTHSTPIPGGASSAPVVAGGTVYVVSARGQLHAFR